MFRLDEGRLSTPPSERSWSSEKCASIRAGGHHDLPRVVKLCSTPFSGDRRMRWRRDSGISAESDLITSANCQLKSLDMDASQSGRYQLERREALTPSAKAGKCARKSSGQRGPTRHDRPHPTAFSRNYARLAALKVWVAALLERGVRSRDLIQLLSGGRAAPMIEFEIHLKCGPHPGLDRGMPLAVPARSPRSVARCDRAGGTKRAHTCCGRCTRRWPDSHPKVGSTRQWISPIPLTAAVGSRNNQSKVCLTSYGLQRAAGQTVGLRRRTLWLKARYEVTKWPGSSRHRFGLYKWSLCRLMR
jgi:hypothetical protein